MARRRSNWFIRIANNQMDFGDLLFHGTGEPIEGDLGARSAGGILWVAENPATAQNYIPESGSTAMLGGFDDYSLNDSIRPSQGIITDLLHQMGWQFDVEYDGTGRVVSWGSKDPRGFPKNKDVKHYVENVLGYQKNSNGVYWLKLVNGKIYPANYKMPGTLYIFTGRQNLKILDLTGGSDEDDLMDPTYNKINTFEKAKAAGYDGVRINDFTQSEYWGNFGHKSIGLFESALKKLQQEKVPATNFDWSDDARYRQDTDEYNNWKNKPIDPGV